MTKPTFKQWKALFYKDLMDLRWNGQVQFNFIICLLITIVFLWFPRDSLPISFVIGFTFAMVTMFTQGNLVVEEREQGTFRRLNQVGFSLKHMVVGKMFVTLFVTSILVFLFLLFYRFDPTISFNLIILSFPVVLIMILAGTFIGLNAKNTIDVSLYGTPLTLFYLFLEGLLMSHQPGRMEWLGFFPNYHLYYGVTSSNVTSHLLVPYLWMTIILLLFVWWFKKRQQRV
ncbi:ABC transporter permease [Shouchella sp. JSM 1781072]|uniref:ABC transporter permease n=1 Tax=Shouchella sp. JSM 1781072 TaxID=3344581 RepID=UPI0035C0B1EF